MWCFFLGHDLGVNILVPCSCLLSFFPPTKSWSIFSPVPFCYAFSVLHLTMDWTVEIKSKKSTSPFSCRHLVFCSSDGKVANMEKEQPGLHPFLKFLYHLSCKSVVLSYTASYFGELKLIFPIKSSYILILALKSRISYFMIEKTRPWNKESYYI